MASDSDTVLVVGTGNELLGDEGLGVHVARLLLARNQLPQQMEVLEAGTALLDLLPEMSRHSRVILVDAVRTGRKPGTLYRLELVAGSVLQPESFSQVSLHEWGILETLQAAKMLGLMPRQLTLLGAEPQSLEPSTELSPALAKAAEQIVSILLEDVESQLGTENCEPRTARQ